MRAIWKIGVKRLVLLLSAVAVLIGAFAATYAYLEAQTPAVTNAFEPVEVTCQVEEVFDGTVKKDVCVRNTGDIIAFIRAMVVFNWIDANGRVLANAPVEGVDYTIQWGDTSWMLGADGFWYYTRAVVPQEVTAHIVNSVTCNAAPEGYHLQVQVLATAIQAHPSTAAVNAWGARVDGHNLTPP